MNIITKQSIGIAYEKWGNKVTLTPKLFKDEEGKSIALCQIVTKLPITDWEIENRITDMGFKSVEEFLQGVSKTQKIKKLIKSDMVVTSLVIPGDISLNEIKNNIRKFKKEVK